MAERVKADGTACNTCAAKTWSSEGYLCQPHKLGQSNGKRRFVLGRMHAKGTTMRPQLCPHPESVVSTTSNAFVMLRKKLES